MHTLTTTGRLRWGFLEEALVYDLLVLMLLVVAFICGLGYVRACDGLTRSEGPVKETSQ